MALSDLVNHPELAPKPPPKAIPAPPADPGLPEVAPPPAPKPELVITCGHCGFKCERSSTPQFGMFGKLVGIALLAGAGLLGLAGFAVTANFWSHDSAAGEILSSIDVLTRCVVFCACGVLIALGAMLLYHRQLWRCRRCGSTHERSE